MKPDVPKQMLTYIFGGLTFDGHDDYLIEQNDDQSCCSGHCGRHGVANEPVRTHLLVVRENEILHSESKREEKGKTIIRGYYMSLNY